MQKRNEDKSSIVDYLKSLIVISRKACFMITEMKKKFIAIVNG